MYDRPFPSLTSLVSLRCLRLLLSRMVGDHPSSLSLVRTRFSLPPLIGVEVTKLPPSLSMVSEDTLCPQSLSELGLALNLVASRLGAPAVVATPSILAGTGIADEWVWSDDIMELVWSGRLRKMEGEKVSSLLLEDFSFE